MENIVVSLLLGALFMSNPAISDEIITIEREIKTSSVLKQPSKSISFPLSQEDKDLMQVMEEKLYALDGVGLAAPQINQPKNIVAIYIPEDAALLRDNIVPYPMHFMINATYEGIEAEGKYQDFEACYSVSSKAGFVPRYNKIKVTYQDETGKLISKEESGFYARVIQHELDHVQGILILDRLTPDCVQGSMDEMIALRRESLSEAKRAAFDELLEKKKMAKES